MICLTCCDFSFQRANSENAKGGFGCCKHREDFVVFSAKIERDCDRHNKATPDVIKRREKFLDTWK